MDVVICEGPPTCKYLGVFLTDTQWAEFQAQAAARGVDVHEWAEEVIVKHLEESNE